ncbi:MAG: major capsid protein [Microvirus sp.]|nr:MAG: major capsid protein [Microvirus sp.]
MKMPSSTGMQHRFSEVPQANIERSVFDRSHSHKTMFDPDYLIPFYIDEVLPGDTFNVDVTNFIRMSSALNVPVMDNIYLDTFFFYVPNRLLWTNFQKFMGEQTNPGDSVSYTKPQIVADAATGFVVGSLSDYFGLPTGVNSLSVDSQFHRAYNLIWNQWFRDQNIQNSVTVGTGDGPDSITDYVLLKRGKRHDYFTSCLPFAQKGTAVSIPLSGTAPIALTGSAPYPQPIVKVTSSGALDTTAQYLYGKATTGYLANVSYASGVVIDPNGSLSVDLSAASASTINALRLAFQTQKMLERDARGGTRYTEIVKSHFGVTSPDARLQRPEFLGGRSTPIQISSVPQTSATASQPTPQGNLSAFALGTNTRDGFTKSFTEHGVIMGLCMVRADLTYQQGLNKMFSRLTRLEYYFPSLSHIGEQAVLTKEIYCLGAAGGANDNTVFGYQERFAEYRYYPSKITGKLRSTYSTPLDVWHLAQKFTSAPTLSDTFIKETMPITRIEAVTTQPAFVMDSFVNCKAVRPMPVYSVPGMIDHF